METPSFILIQQATQVLVVKADQFRAVGRFEDADLLSTAAQQFSVVAQLLIDPQQLVIPQRQVFEQYPIALQQVRQDPQNIPARQQISRQQIQSADVQFRDE